MTLKILQVSKLYPPFFGGIETVVYDISNWLAKHGYLVDVLCVSENNTSQKEVTNGVNIFRCSSFAHIFSVYLSFSFIRKWYSIRNEYDIIHIHMPNPLANLAYLLFPTKSKLVLHWHSDIIKQKFLKKLLKPIESWLLYKSDLIIVTTPPYLTHSNSLKNHKDKVIVLPVGIEENSLSFNEDLVYKIKQKYKNKHIVFALGRHVYYKGFSFLIEAAKHLSDDTIVLIGGIGQLTKTLEKQIIDKNLQNRVFLLGKIKHSELGSYYKACDVFCLPSIEKSEAYGVVQLEAMMFGKPVVSNNILGSGVSWVNRDGITGYVSHNKDILSLAECLKKAINSFDESKIQNYFISNFTSSIMNERLDVIYKDLF